MIFWQVWLCVTATLMSTVKISSCVTAHDPGCITHTSSGTITDIGSCSPLPCYLPSLDHLLFLGHAPQALGHYTTVHIVLCNDSSALETTLMFREIGQLRISGGANEKHVVKCTANDSGMEFIQVHGIRLQHIVLVGCGFTLNQGNGLTASILVMGSSEVVLEGVVISDATGIGVGLLDVSNSNVSNCVFERGREMGEMKQSSERSGLFIQINEHNTSHHISSCCFAAAFQTTPHSVHNNITHGGGICVSIQNQSSYNFVSISDSTFTHNSAREGGAVYISIQDSSANNSVAITRSEFRDNSATETGGAIAAAFTPSSSPRNTLPRGNKMEIAGCNFTRNKAPVGGALQVSFAIEKISCTGRRNEIELTDCQWVENEANFGAAIDVRPYTGAIWSAEMNTLLIVLKDCNFEHNTVKWSGNKVLHTRGEGAVRLWNSELDVVRELRLNENTGSALYLESSTVTFERDSVSTFTENEGYQGGAIALMEYRSTIYVKDNCTILFLRNLAYDLGGAIFQQHSKSCFIAREELDSRDSESTQPESGVQIQFDNNTAEVREGDSVFVSSLKPCMEVYQTDYYQEALSTIANISFANTEDKTLQVSTLGRVMHSKPLHSAVPGKEADLKVWMEDDTGTTTMPYLQIITDSFDATVVAGYTYNGYKKVKFQGKPGSVVQLKISPQHLQELELDINVTLSECPPGYYYYDSVGANETKTSDDASDRICICSANSLDSRNRYIGIQTCDPLKFRATLRHSHWAGYQTNENNETVLMTSYCTRGFCARSEKERKDILLPSNTSHYDLSDWVCSENRTGVLCARCHENHSVFFPTFHSCRKNKNCELGWLFYILSQLVPVTLLFSVIIALDINLTSGALGSIIFYIQSFDLLVITGNDFLWFEPHLYNLIKGLRMISRASNLRFFARSETSFCIWEGATALDVIAFNYVTYIYALFLVVFTVKCVKPCLHRVKVKCLRTRNNSRKLNSVKTKLSGSIIHGLTGFLVLCYSQSTYISLHLIAYTRLYEMGGKGGEKLVFYNGELKFFKGKHLAYALPATFFLVVITIIPPLLLLCYPLCYRVLAICRLQESKFAKLLCTVIPLEKYKPLFDSLQGSFKDEHRYFAGLFFSYRLVILLTFAYLRVVATFYVILQVELSVMLVLHAWAQPHKKNWHNRLDVFVFLVLLVINSCSIYSYHKRADYSDSTPHVSTFQVLIAYLPHLYALGYVVMEMAVFIRKKLKERKRCSGSERLEELLDSRDQLEEMLLSRAEEMNTSPLLTSGTESSSLRAESTNINSE